MSEFINSASFSQVAASAYASARQLAGACYLVARILVPLTVLCLLLPGALHLLYQRNPSRTDGMRRLNIDHFIVLEQVRRAAVLPAADIAFFGDSSCLMGIDPGILERALDIRPIQSFCSIGYLGPAGYAYMLDGMIARNAAPNVLVFMFHPATFRREAGWEYWPPFVRNAGNAAPPSLTFPRSALDYLEFEWLSRLIYSPLPAAYGRYYGGEGAFRSSIEARQGSARDPNTGLNVASIEALKAIPTPPQGTPTDFSANQAYRDALQVLGETLRKLPSRTSVYLIVSPLPDYTFRPGTAAQRAEVANEIALALGIGGKHILDTPATMFSAYFASHTHLNRWGQQIFSGELAKQLAVATTVARK